MDSRVKNLAPSSSSSSSKRNQHDLHSNELDKLTSQLKFDSILKNSLDSLSNELHLQRLKSLRETAEQLNNDSWLYPAPNGAIERLLSL